MTFFFVRPDQAGGWTKRQTVEIDGDEIIERQPLKIIFGRMSDNRIEVITGPRQCGKTTLMNLLMHRLNESGVSGDDIFYVNVDTIIEAGIFADPLAFLERLPGGAVKQRRYLFIDEVQRLPDPGLFLKALHDLRPNLKIIVSGSSSLEVRAAAREHLTGRKWETHLLPLSMAEIVAHRRPELMKLKAETLTAKTIKDWQRHERAHGPFLKSLLQEMMMFGGYPRTVTEKDESVRTEELAEIYLSYVRRDIVEFLRVGRAELFNRTVQALAGQIGCLVNKSELGGLVGTTVNTLDHYFDLLRETYVVHFLPPYSRNKRNELKSMKKVYFIDTGLRNLAARSLGTPGSGPEQGHLLENCLFAEMRKRQPTTTELYFWRTKAGAEVDFIIEGKAGAIPVEVKTNTARPGMLPQSFRSFLNHYRPPLGIMLNRDVFGVEQIDNVKIHYIPNHWFALFGEVMVTGKG